ncbi:TPA: hypothetical protein I9786_002255 [Serratia marcescens]|nr:hypothetical protein [Serratia marcescens]HAT5029649.1 hypothetical protein [Serratia marcescens]
MGQQFAGLGVLFVAGFGPVTRESDDRWPADLAVPQAWIEFDVADMAAATQGLVDRGYRLLVANREEPWGQSVTRLLSPEGLLVGVTYTPWLR